MNTSEIQKLLYEDDELYQLYLNNAIFHKAIDTFLNFDKVSVNLIIGIIAELSKVATK